MRKEQTDRRRKRSERKWQKERVPLRVVNSRVRKLVIGVMLVGRREEKIEGKQKKEILEGGRQIKNL